MALSIRQITDENRLHVLNLHVAPHQVTFIETTQECLAEAQNDSRWHPVALYDKEILVGFAMYGEFPSDQYGSCVWLDRLLIGEQYQHHGFGEQALKLLMDLLKREYHCSRIFLSLYDDNTVAKRLYQKHGFVYTGTYDTKGERIMVKDFLAK